MVMPMTPEEVKKLRENDEEQNRKIFKERSLSKSTRLNDKPNKALHH